MAKQVLVPMADGSEEMEAVIIIDTLRRAGAEVTVASLDRHQITGMMIKGSKPVLYFVAMERPNRSPRMT